MQKCNTCAGEYEPIQTDGTQYFHACPPLSRWEIEAQLEQRTIALPARDAKRLEDATRLDAETPVARGEPTRRERVLESLVVERPNKRDENVTGPATKDRAAPIRADGAGVTKI